MSKQMKKMLLIMGILFGLLFSWYFAKKGMTWWFMSHYKAPPITISAKNAETKTWQSYISTVGTLEAINGVELSSEAPGMVKEIRFESGQFVKQGDILVVLDTKVEEAQLKNAKAELKLTQLNYDRQAQLAKSKFISPAMLDSTYAKLQEAASTVEEIEAQIEQKIIKAPFSGKVGIRLINLGEYLAAGKSIVTLQSLDPLYVRFNLPEQELQNLKPGELIDVSVNMNHEQTVQGKITALNAKVDQSSRHIMVQGTIPNKNLDLYPGMFASVKIWLPPKNNVLTLPQTAITYSLHGDSVFIIKETKTDKNNKPILNAYRQYVKTGERRGNEVAIIEGLKPTDRIVTSGQLKLQNGAEIIIDNSVAL